DAYDFSRALEAVWSLVASVDGFLTATAPWKKDEDVTEEQQQAYRSTILYIAAEAIRIITALVYPVIPEAAAKVWAQLGLGDIHKADLKNLEWGGLKPGTKLGEASPLFPRADKEAITRMSELEQKNNGAAAATTAAKPQDARISKLHSLIDGLAVAMAESTSESAAVTAFDNAIGQTLREMFGVGIRAAAPVQPAATAAPAAAPAVPGEKISIDDFSKVELRVAQVKVAERVPKADKLLRLEVDLGYETRQILAGIAEAYTPESLIGRKVVIVANLAPRKLRGLESNGMIVAASVEGGRPVLASFLEDVEIGARLK
ncbi:MAG: methionine--tRNA ligase subunit beta, partial [Acidobacteriaceae bacterium]